MTSFRKPAIEDLDPIFSIEKRVQPNPWGIQQIESEIVHANPHSRVLTGPYGQILGYIFVRHTGNEFEVLNVAVAPDHLRRGYGWLLFQEVFKIAPLGAEIFLEVSSDNIPALKLYRKLGFVEIGRRKCYYRDGSDAINMRRTLCESGTPPSHSDAN